MVFDPTSPHPTNSEVGRFSGIPHVHPIVHLGPYRQSPSRRGTSSCIDASDNPSNQLIRAYRLIPAV